MDIVTQWVKVKGEDVILDCYFAKPSQPGNYPAIVVIQEVFGVNIHIREVTEKIAEEGYIAIAPAIYQRQVIGFDVGYSEAELALGRKYKDGTKAKELLSDLNAVIDFVEALPEALPVGVGLIGFCFGGHVAYLGATLDRVKVTASFYGAGIPLFCPAENKPTIDRTHEIKGTIYCFFGTEDPLIPNEQVKEIQTILDKEKIDYKLFHYEGATHGFFCNYRNSYHPQYAQQAWLEVLDLFSQLAKTSPIS